jgi:hypothetical protein
LKRFFTSKRLFSNGYGNVALDYFATDGDCVVRIVFWGVVLVGKRGMSFAFEPIVFRIYGVQRPSAAVVVEAGREARAEVCIIRGIFGRGAGEQSASGLAEEPLF